MGESRRRSGTRVLLSFRGILTAVLWTKAAIYSHEFQQIGQNPGFLSAADYSGS